jgi:hypothetical protein
MCEDVGVCKLKECSSIACRDDAGRNGREHRNRCDIE